MQRNKESGIANKPSRTVCPYAFPYICPFACLPPSLLSFSLSAWQAGHKRSACNSSIKRSRRTQYVHIRTCLYIYIYIPLYVGYKTRYTCAIVFSLVIFNLSAAIYQLLLPSLLFTCSGEAKKIIIVDLWQRKAFALPPSLPPSLSSNSCSSMCYI